MVSFNLNNRHVSVDADANTPLLWIIRDHVGLTGTGATRVPDRTWFRCG